MEVVGGLIFLALLAAIWIVPAGIAFAKGQIVWGVLGLLLFAPLGWVGALMRAKPGSWWARNRYGEQVTLPEAALAAPPASPSAFGEVATDPGGDWECGICGERSATRAAAESHVRGSHPQAPVESSISPASD